MHVARRTRARFALLVSIATATTVLATTPFAGAAPTALTTGVVEVQTRYALAGGSGAGTGMILTASGEVLTSNHVIRGATQIRIRVPDTGRTYRARVLGYSISADLALLKLTGAVGLETVSLGNSSTVAVGDAVTAVGNEGGTGAFAVKEGTITRRSVSITVGDGESAARLRRVLETSADLRQGDSGGPLLDSAGRVVGVNAAASFSRSGDSDGYAIPINRARTITAQIRSGTTTATVHVGPTPFLGVSIASPAEGETSPRGVLVAGVSPGSPASRAGIEPDDVIDSFNGNQVRTRSDLVTRLLRWRPGDRVRIGWLDAFGSRSSALVTLASGPPQ
jgi:S1-C subfamily serine protease